VDGLFNYYVVGWKRIPLNLVGVYIYSGSYLPILTKNKKLKFNEIMKEIVYLQPGLEESSSNLLRDK
jgi:hypothetical protein